MQSAVDGVKTLRARGFVEQVSHETELVERMEARPVSFYLGIEPSGDSMHVGHLLPVMATAWLQRCGHRPILVVGGGTAMVGDPSGKDEMRKLISRETIEHNTAALSKQLAHFVDLGPEGARLVDNAEWLLPLNYIEFLREIGSAFSVNKMLAAEAYKQRLERGLSFIEFNYQLLQAYDFLVLHERYGCELQIGGNDQWGNIVAGTDLIRRKTGHQAYALTLPLIMNAEGKKMGKTAKGAVWLDPDKLSPFDYYQYWINVPDADVARLMRFYTFLPNEEIDAYGALEGKDVRQAKAALAQAATALVHGEDEAIKAERGASAMVAGTGTEDLPTHTITEASSVAAVLADAGLVKSRGEARRMVQQGAVQLDGEKVSDFELLLEPGAEGLVLRVGKKRAVRVVAG